MSTSRTFRKGLFDAKTQNKKRPNERGRWLSSELEDERELYKSTGTSRGGICDLLEVLSLSVGYLGHKV
jgi:hypothetical protein